MSKDYINVGILPTCYKTNKKCIHQNRIQTKKLNEPVILCNAACDKDEDGYVFAWKNGRTSFSIKDKNDCVWWSEAILYKEEC